MKNCLLVVCIFCFISCNNEKQKEKAISINLNKKEAAIPYSYFVDSISYTTFHLGDSLFMTGIEKLYVDGDYLILRDNMLGFFIFSLTEKKLIKHINHYGSGPGEYAGVRSFTINDEANSIAIYSYPFIHNYTYDDQYIGSVMNAETNFVDFYQYNSGEYICIAPENMGPVQPRGVWLADSGLKFIKQLKETPSNQEMRIRAGYCNRDNNGLYYYDWTYDDISYITKDSVTTLYQFDLKQRIPQELRTRDFDDDKLKGYSHLGDFVHSNRFILLNYYTFGKEGVTWVLFDKLNEKTINSNALQNDITNEETLGIHYIDEQTWARVFRFDEEEPTITFEWLHLKK